MGLNASIRGFVISLSATLGVQAMPFDPFPPCGTYGKRDSVHTLTFLNKDGVPLEPPHRSFEKLEYFPGNCFVSRGEYGHSLLSQGGGYTARLGPENRTLEETWEISGVPSSPKALVWLAADGRRDSALIFTFFRGDDGIPVKGHLLERIEYAAAYETHKYWYGPEAGPLGFMMMDSIVRAGNDATIWTSGKEQNTITRCRDSAATYVCLQEAGVGENVVPLKRQVWHLTAGRPDSLRTYLLDGSLHSVDHYSWSPRGPISVKRRVAGGSGHRAAPGSRDLRDATGRLRGPGSAPLHAWTPPR